MKHLLRNILLAGAACMTLVSCWDEDIEPKDNLRGYETVTGDFAYIVDGTSPEYEAVRLEVFHTPDGEVGTIERTFEVGLTKAQSSSVTVTVGLDNDAVEGAYSAFPDGFLTFDSSVTIPAGETRATVSVTSNSSTYASALGDGSYMAVFRIQSASGVQVSTNSNEALLYVTTETIDPSENMVYLEGGQSSFSIRHYIDGVLGDNISQSFSLTGTEEAFYAFDATLSVDNSLIAAYNEANGTNYQAVPDGIVQISNPHFDEGATSGTGSVYINDGDRFGNLNNADGFLIPVRLTDAGPATVSENAGVFYIIIEVSVFETSANYFSALYLGDYRMATWYMFPEAMDFSSSSSDGYTIVFHVLMEEVTQHSRIGNFADANENWINMLRYGQLGNNDTRLEWWVGPNGCRKQLYAPAIETNKWYCYALVYVKGDGYYMYLDGQLADSYTLTDEDKAAMESLAQPSFQAIEFNSSWGANYREGNEFHGRLYGVSVCPTWLPDYYIQYYFMDREVPAYLTYFGGAAWSFGDGNGHIVKAAEGSVLGDIDFSNTTRCDDESSMVSADVSQYIQWKTDELNDFDE